MTRAEKNNKLCEEIKLLVNLFLKTNLSDIELSEKTGISSSTVGRRLTNKEKIIEVFDKPENKISKYKNLTGNDLYELIRDKRKSNLDKARKKGGITAYNKQKNSILNDLNMDAKSKYNFLALCVLTFRLHMPNVEELVNMNKENIIKNLMQYNPQEKEAFRYLFTADKTNQTKCLNAFNKYYKGLKETMKKKDKKKVHELLFAINDNYVINLIGQTKLTNRDIKEIINYQIKHAKTTQEISKLIKIPCKELNNKIKECLKTNKQLQSSYFNLLNYLRR